MDPNQCANCTPEQQFILVNGNGAANELTFQDERQLAEYLARNRK